MKKIIFTILVALAAFSVVSYAGQIYDNARQAGIDAYNRGQYQVAIKQFIAAQNIAPIDNDLTHWLSKCNRKLALQNNRKSVDKKSSIRKNNQIQNRSDQLNLQKTGNLSFDSILNTENGMSLVMRSGKFGYINQNKEIKVPIIYDNVDIFGIADTVTVGEYRSVIERTGKWRGIAMSVQREEKWGFVDKEGQEIILCKYDIVENCIYERDSIIPVAIGETYGYVNTKDVEVIPFIYEAAGKFLSNGLAPVVKNNKLGYINYNGETIIDFIYDPRYELKNGKASLKEYIFLDGMMPICKNGKWGLINEKGEEVYPFVFDDFINGYLSLGLIYYIFIKNDKECYLFNGKVYDNEEELTEAKLRFKAASNTPEYIYNLALYYWDRGEYNRSSDWATKGNKLNHGGCSRLLGMYWLYCTDIPSMARPYLIKAADQEDDEAQYLLGFMYENDLVVGNDLKKKSEYRRISNQQDAINWYKKSAKNGNAQAIDKLKSLGVSIE